MCPKTSTRINRKSIKLWSEYVHIFTQMANQILTPVWHEDFELQLITIFCKFSYELQVTDYLKYFQIKLSGISQTKTRSNLR